MSPVIPAPIIRTWVSSFVGWGCMLNADFQAIVYSAFQGQWIMTITSTSELFNSFFFALSVKSGRAEECWS